MEDVSLGGRGNLQRHQLICTRIDRTGEKLFIDTYLSRYIARYTLCYLSYQKIDGVHVATEVHSAVP